MSGKKTLYEMLGVAPDATFAEIEAAYARALRTPEQDAGGPTAGDGDLQSKVLKMAFQTLSNEKSRQAYDARLGGASPTQRMARDAFVTQSPPPAHVTALPLQAEAVALKADAASLIAEAAILKAAASSLQIEATPAKVAALVGRGVRATFTALGAVMTLVVALLFGLWWVSSPSRQSAAEAEKAQERVMIQEYYQTHGVRPKSRTELELLEAENRRRADAERQKNREKQEADRKERDYQRWVDDTRRQAEQITQENQRAKERADQEARYAADKARMELRMKEEAERRRIENERHKLGLH